MAEALVRTLQRDYVRMNARPVAQAVIDELPGRFAHYNEVRPHRALRYRSPHKFIARTREALSGLETEISARIRVRGMPEGWFAGDKVGRHRLKGGHSAAPDELRAPMSTGQAAESNPRLIGLRPPMTARVDGRARASVPVSGARRARLAMSAGGTQSTGSAVCSNGSGATGGVEAGRRCNSHNQGDVWELIWGTSRQGGALGKLNLPRQLSDRLNQNEMQCRDECV